MVLFFSFYTMLATTNPSLLSLENRMISEPPALTLPSFPPPPSLTRRIRTRKKYEVLLTAKSVNIISPPPELLSALIFLDLLKTIVLEV